METSCPSNLQFCSVHRGPTWHWLVYTLYYVLCCITSGCLIIMCEQGIYFVPHHKNLHTGLVFMGVGCLFSLERGYNLNVRCLLNALEMILHKTIPKSIINYINVFLCVLWPYIWTKSNRIDYSGWCHFEHFKCLLYPCQKKLGKIITLKSSRTKLYGRI